MQLLATETKDITIAEESSRPRAATINASSKPISIIKETSVASRHRSLSSNGAVLKDKSSSNQSLEKAAPIASAEGKIFGSIFDTYAFFCRTDIEPKMQRKLLFAINHRHLTVLKHKQGSSKVVQDTFGSKNEKKGNKNGMGFVGGKLNSILRTKKQKKTRAGVFHSLHLAIHDLRSSEALANIELLSDQTLTKKRPIEANRAFLHALSNRMQSVCIAMMEKGFPKNVNCPIYASNFRDPSAFTFPTYFQLAVATGLYDVAKLMIKCKADIELSWYQVTPLLSACLQGNEKLCQLLIESGANPCQKLGFDDYLVLKRLKPADISVMNKLDPSAALLAIPTKKPNVDRGVFMQFGQSSNIPITDFAKDKELCLFELAAANGHYDIASYLFDQSGAAHITSSLFSLLLSNNYKWSKKIIADGVKVSQLDPQGCNALHIAARRGDVDMVIVLIQGGIDINSKGFNGWTALHEAVSVSSLPVVHYLLYKFADRNLRNDANETAKEVAVKKGVDSATLDLFFVQPGDTAVFLERERAIIETEILKSSLVIGTPTNNKSKDRLKFGSLFGNSRPSSAASAKEQVAATANSSSSSINFFRNRSSTAK